MTSSRVAAGILVAGRSTRMGRPKALLRVDGQTLLERTFDVARRVADETILLGEPPFALPAALSRATLIPDHPPGAGPIGGLAALLSARPGSRGLLLACDMPRIDDSLLARLIDLLDPLLCDVAVPQTHDAATGQACLHPCCAIYDAAILPRVLDAIRLRRFGLTDLLAQLRTATVPLAGPEAALVENWNYPDDLPP